MYYHNRRLDQESSEIEPLDQSEHKRLAIEAIEDDRYVEAYEHMVYALDHDIPSNECVTCGEVGRFDDTGECVCGRRRNRLHESKKRPWSDF